MDELLGLENALAILGDYLVHNETKLNENAVKKIKQLIHGAKKLSEDVSLKDPKKYFVFEGLDGTGKTTTAAKFFEYLKEKNPDKKIVFTKTPPIVFNDIREIFDNEVEKIKRAYYVAGNYYFGIEMFDLDADMVVVDRWWPSTLSFVNVYHLISQGKPLPPNGDSSYAWPKELHKPINFHWVLMTVENQTRLSRLKQRSPEAHKIETDKENHELVAKMVIDYYRHMPNINEFDASGSTAEILKSIVNHFEKVL